VLVETPVNAQSSGSQGNILLEEQGQLEVGDTVLNDNTLYDEFAFEGRAGDVVSITLESSEFDTYLFLISPEGEKLAENDDIAEGNTNSKITVTLPTNGTYRVQANGFREQDRGRYSLRIVSRESNSDPNRESDLSLQEEGVLEAEDNVYEDGTFYDEYTFYGKAGDTVSITLESLEFDTWLILISPAGEILDRDGDIEVGNTNSWLTTTLPIDGVYTIVANSEKRSQGQYILTMVPGGYGPILGSDGGRQIEAAALYRRGRDTLESETSLEAIPYFEKALEIFREIGDLNGQSYSLENIGGIYTVLGRYADAQSFLEQAINIEQSRNNLQRESEILPVISLAHLRQGQFEEAISYSKQMLSVLQELENSEVEEEVFALTIIGTANYRLGRFQESLGYLEQALPIADRLGNRFLKATILNNIGLVYISLGQYQSASSYIEQALKNYKEFDISSLEGLLLHDLIDPYGESTALQNLGIIHFIQEDYQIALEYLEHALTGFERSENLPGKGLILSNIGLIYVVDEQYQKALSYFDEALAIQRETNDPYDEINTLLGLALAYDKLEQYEKSLEYLSQSLMITRQIDDKFGQGAVFAAIGRVLEVQDQSKSAIAFMKQSVNLREGIRNEIQGLSLEIQQSYTNTVADDYRFLAELLLEQGRISEAQQVLDLLKLEELREFTDTTRATWTGDTLEYSDAEQAVIDAHDSIVALGSEIVACEDTGCAELDDLDNQLEALKTQYHQQVAEFEATIRANRADDEIFQNPDNLSGDAEELLSAYAASGQTALLIYPFVLEDKLWLVYAAQGSVIGSVEVPVSQGELSTTVQRFGELLTSSTNLEELQATSQQLYDWIIQPLESELTANDIDHLVFVNDRVTRYIPMAALYDGEQYLLERYTISTVLAPGLTDTTDQLESIDQSQVLGLGLTQAVANFSSLPAVDIELDAIVRSGADDALGIYPGQVLLNDAFTLDTLKENVRDHRILHMATHAAFVPGRP
jgi:tetratricopeptide (TPR) repeat protein